jgi:hypothetical protein
MRPKSKKFPVFSLMIREFDGGERFDPDCSIPQPVITKRIVSAYDSILLTDALDHSSALISSALRLMLMEEMREARVEAPGAGK